MLCFSCLQIVKHTEYENMSSGPESEAINIPEPVDDRENNEQCYAIPFEPTTGPVDQVPDIPGIEISKNEPECSKENPIITGKPGNHKCQ